jgi:hypothetical protein
MIPLDLIFDAGRWTFSPGPAHQAEPVDTVNCFEVVEHPIESMNVALLSFPGIERVDTEGSVCRARLVWSADYPPLELTTAEWEWYPGVWGCIEMQGRCSVGAIMTLWAHLLANLPGIWLFLPGEEPDLLHTPRSFLQSLVRAGSDQS